MLIQINTIILVQITNIIITNISSKFKRNLCAFFKNFNSNGTIFDLRLKSKGARRNAVRRRLPAYSLLFIHMPLPILFRAIRLCLFWHECFWVFRFHNICTTSAKCSCIFDRSDFFFNGTASFAGFPMGMLYKNGKIIELHRFSWSSRQFIYVKLLNDE